jgi:cyclase
VFGYESVQVADGIHVFGESKRNPVPSGNVTAVIGDEAVLVFDTGNHPEVTKRIIGDIRRLTAKPVRFVVNSHWHDDHWVGNAEFADAFPRR